MTDKRDASTLADQLGKLTELRNSGAITQSEFELAKQQVLGVSGLSAAPTLPGRAAAPDAPADEAPPPTGAGPVVAVELGAMPVTEMLPDIPAGGFTLGGLRGEDDGQPPLPPSPRRPRVNIEPDPAAELELVSRSGADAGPGISLQWIPVGEPETGGSNPGVPGPPDFPDDAPLELSVTDLLPDVPPAVRVEPSPRPAGGAPGPIPGLPGVSAGDPSLELAASHAPASGLPPAVARGYLYSDGVADEHRALRDLGGSVPRTAWMIGGGLLALMILLLVLSAGARVWFGGTLFVVGALLAIAGSIWLLVEAARTSVLWLILYLFVPFANLAFVIVHWTTAKRPFATNLVGVGMLVLGAVLFTQGSAGSGGGCGTRTCQKKRGKGASRGSTPIGVQDDDGTERARRRAVRWRPGGGFSCAALQERVDDCEDEWVDQLELLLKRPGMPANAMRISVDRPRIAVKQAQALVFERGERHRCEAAQRRKLPVETEWLSAVQGCFALKRCKSFSACHAKVFLGFVGRLPFSCRFACNKELYQCAAEVLGSSLGRQQGFRGRLDEDRLDKARPGLYARCLKRCKRNLRTAETREAVLQCMFQPTCKGFVDCLKPIPPDR